MQSETMHSDHVDFSISIAETDRFADDKAEAPKHRQLCGITIYLAEFVVRVSIHTAIGTASHSIPRHFPGKEIYLETDFSDSMAPDNEV